MHFYRHCVQKTTHSHLVWQRVVWLDVPNVMIVVTTKFALPLDDGFGDRGPHRRVEVDHRPSEGLDRGVVRRLQTFFQVP